MTKHAAQFPDDMEMAVVSLDALVDSFGGCGLFQVLLVLATYSTQLVGGWAMFFMVFGNYNPGWQCMSDPALNVNHLMGNSSGEEELNSTQYNQSYNFQHEDTLDVEFDNLTDTESCPALERCANVVFDPSASTIVTEWNLLCDLHWVQAVIILVQMVGVFIGSFLSGYTGDRYGRKLTLYGSVAGCGVLNLIAIFSVSWQMFAVIRFLLGICAAGILATSFMYPLEFMNQWARGLMGSLPMWNIGAAIFAVVVMLLKDWRHIHIACAVTSVFILLPVFWVPESLRWLSVQGKVDKAKQIANRISRTNNRPPPNTVILEAIAETEEKLTGGGKKMHEHSLMDLFTTKSVRKTSLVMGFVWICISMIYYAISFGIKSLSGDFYINFVIFSAAEIPGMIFVAPAVNKLGRRLACLLFMISMALACFCVVLVFFVAPEDIKGTVITVLAILAKVNIIQLWNAVIIYCSELYPTVVRNISSGFLNSTARIGGIIAPYLIPSSPELLYVSFVIMGVVLVTCCLLLLLLPETKGKKLEDVLGHE